MNPGTLLLCRYTVGTYCCVFIMLLQKRDSAVQNSNIRGLSLKVNVLSCWKYALHQTQPFTCPIVLTNAKHITTYVLMQPCHFNFLICRCELFCQTLIPRNSNRSPSPSKYVSVLRELPNKLTVWKPIDTRLDMCDANVQKHQFSNLPAFLKS